MSASLQCFRVHGRHQRVMNKPTSSRQLCRSCGLAGVYHDEDEACPAPTSAHKSKGLSITWSVLGALAAAAVVALAGRVS